MPRRGRLRIAPQKAPDFVDGVADLWRMFFPPAFELVLIITTDGCPNRIGLPRLAGFGFALPRQILEQVDDGQEHQKNNIAIHTINRRP